MENMTKEQVLLEIEKLQRLKNEKFNEEQGIKDIINSIYGATANEFFSLFDINISEAITLQGQEVIKYSENLITDYFLNRWHLDTELHDKMGLTEVRKLYIVPTIYIDTDSNYVSYEEMLNSCDWKGTGTEFILLFNKLRFSEYLETEFIKYSEERSTKSHLNFELENISYSGIFVKKKKYAYDLAWADPGVNYMGLSKIKFKGLEIIQSSTPKFARENLKELTKLIFIEKKKLNFRNFMLKIRAIKEEFKLQDIDNISMSFRVNGYDKYILNDTTRLELASGCQMHVRAAGTYNMAINSSKFKNKYPLIKSGDKIKFYLTHNKTNNVYGFLPNQFPYEIAPEMDYDSQFAKLIIDPINRLLNVVIQTEIPANLMVSKKLF